MATNSNENFFVINAHTQLLMTPQWGRGKRGIQPGGVLSYKRLIGMCHWMGSHFHDWSDYNGVAFSIDLLEWGRKFSDFWGK